MVRKNAQVNDSENDNENVNNQQTTDSSTIQGIVDENKRLQEEMNELKEMLKQFLTKPKETEQVKTPDISYEDEMMYMDEIPKVDPYKQIVITNLFNGGMTLTGNNKRFRFDGFGMSRTITFNDLQDIVNNHPNFAREMAFLIHDKDAVKALYLEESYEISVNKKIIENFITLPAEKMERIFKSLSQTLQDTVVDIVIQGIREGKKREYTDRNKIYTLEKLSGKDIYKIAQDQIINDK